jgi:alpha-tubulin N-acetyltransferase 1
MLKFENLHPKNFAYDRPSSKLLAFLNKYYNLSSYVKQNNNYVVFNEFFEEKLENTPKNNLNKQSIALRNNNLANIGQQLIKNNESMKSTGSNIEENKYRRK